MHWEYILLSQCKKLAIYLECFKNSLSAIVEVKKAGLIEEKDVTFLADIMKGIKV